MCIKSHRFLCHPYRSWEFHDGIKYQCPGVTVPKCRRFWRALMCALCTEAVHSVALWTRVALGLDMWKVCTEAVHSVALWTRATLGLDMCALCTEAVHSVALWTRVALGLDMCKVCTEAVHSVALWTRATLGLDMCALCTMYRSSPFSSTLNTSYIRFGHV